MLVLHAADLHVGARPYQSDELAIVFRESFEALLETALEEHVDALLVAGDVFDRPRPGNEDIRLVVRGFKRLASRGVPVVLAHGEHDTPGRRGATLLQVIAEAVDKVYAPTPGEGGDIAPTILRLDEATIAVYPMYKVDQATRRKIARKLLPAYRARLEGVSRPRIFLAHLGLQEAIGCPTTDPEECPADTGLESLPPVEYAALGHIHDRIVWGEPPRDPGSWQGPRAAAYPGSLFPKDVGEARNRFPRGPLLVDFSSREPSIQPLSLGVADYALAEARVEQPGTVRVQLQKALAGVLGSLANAPLRVVFLRVAVGPRVPLAAVEREAQRLSRSYQVTVVTRYYRVPGEAPEATGLSKALEVLDPVDILVSEYKLSPRTAGLIVQLKDLLLEDPGNPAIIEVLDKLAESPDFRRIMESMVKSGR